MKNRIYRYVVRFDAGAAPNPFAGSCSLAICKPRIRQTAQVGDWIIGLRSRMADHVIYVMQVEERLSFEDYWSDTRFRDKRPDRCPSSDNIYQPGAPGELVQVPNRVHQPHHVLRDLSSRTVLVSSRYWYFGNNSPKLPDDLVHLVHRRQGHSVDVNRLETDIPDLVQWLAHWSNGVHGQPLNSDLLRPGVEDSKPLMRCVSNPQQPGDPVLKTSHRMTCNG